MADDARRQNLRTLVFQLGFDDESDENEPGLLELYRLATSDDPVARYACVMVEREHESYRTASLVDSLDGVEREFQNFYPEVVPEKVVDLDSGEVAADIEWDEERELRVSVRPR